MDGLLSPYPTLSARNVRDAHDELVIRGYADDEGHGLISLTRDGRDWVLLAIWTRLGCPGFEESWYEDHPRGEE